MTKSYILFLFLLLVVSTLDAQEPSAQEQLGQAKKMLEENSPFNDGQAIVNLIEPLAAAGNAEAQNLLGVLYTKGVGVDKNEEFAFKLIEKAANNGYANAQYNLGRFYKTGTKAKAIDFEKAIVWFKKAIANGHQRAAYSLGYMYYKGLGVQQDYEKAIDWFSKSSDPMAKHFLGLSYYQGYGVPENKDKALEILLKNDIPNSTTLVNYIRNNQKQVNDKKVKESLKTEVSSISANELATETVLDEVDATEIENEPLEAKDILGKWEGKWVQYDWSGNQVEHILPLKMSVENKNGKLKMTYTIMKETKSVDAFWHEDYLYFNEPLTLTLPRLYSSDPNELSLDYELLSIGLKKHTLDDTTLLTGHVDSFITNWSEHGQPTRVLLLPEGWEQTDIEEEKLLQALAEQEEHFIKLYPVPFKEQLTINYQLDNEAEVEVQLMPMSGTNIITISPKSLKKVGGHIHTVGLDGTLPKGLYVVRLIAGNHTYTRLIIKN